MSTKTGAFHRRPSFWKTPITRNSPSIAGIKRNYSQISTESSVNNEAAHDDQNKKRRLLTESEIADIAKFGGIQPSNIILAVQESDGFCWFKRKTSVKSTFDKDKYLEKYWNLNDCAANQENHVLRELSKEEVTKRVQNDKQANEEASGMNPNVRNKQQAVIALQSAAKIRRHTLPPQKLAKLMAEHKQTQEDANVKQKKKKKRKKKKKKKKRVVKYRNEQEVIRKKVKKMKRIVYKKKTRQTTIKITTSYASIAIPNFPVPELSLSVLFVCGMKEEAYVAIKQFELSLMESFVLPLSKLYTNNLSFITRNVLQLMMELQKNIDVVVQCMKYQLVEIPIKKSIVWYKEMKENKSANNGIKAEETSDNCRRKKTKENVEIEKEESEQLENECCFYERHLNVLSEFVHVLNEEIEFTKCVQTEMKDEEYLRNVFDFDLDLNVNNNNNNTISVVNDQVFIENIAADIDGIYSANCMDLFDIDHAQNNYEKELKEREFLLAQNVKEWSNKQGANDDDDDGAQNENNIDELIENETRKITLKEIQVFDVQKDKMIFADFCKTNKHNNYNEDNDYNASTYLRELNGYQMNGDDDTMNMNIDVNQITQ